MLRQCRRNGGSGKDVVVVLSDAEKLAVPVGARLLGGLQFEVMVYMWQVNQATVRRVREAVLRIRSIYSKLAVSSRVQAVVHALSGDQARAVRDTWLGQATP